MPANRGAVARLSIELRHAKIEPGFNGSFNYHFQVTCRQICTRGSVKKPILGGCYVKITHNTRRVKSAEGIASIKLPNKNKIAQITADIRL